ncbi:hypothetical protein M0L20_13775 [Spirosoma sp. RP8]|uniref:Uncharacterized protein n=1 Tax=Spirosoma liriopis TaxID=2937440 RepID=A0ABT0HL82_9BACT|nr:hypothetical protein [Spirosoma liriopis]MCK8492932.1 hypothetical protein [Spirosoma liriopis]
MSKKNLPNGALKWVIGIPATLLLLLFIIGLLAPDSVKAKRKPAEEVTTVEKAPQLIKKAKIYSWAELPTAVKTQVGEYNSFYKGGWSTNRSTRFDRQEAYYVNATINNKQLAELSQSKGFEPEHVLSEKPIYLYGKYKNRWTFQDQQGEISETTKFEGFNTIQVDRVGDQDAVWIGPIPQKPTQMTILGRGDDLENKPVYRF